MAFPLNRGHNTYCPIKAQSHGSKTFSRREELKSVQNRNMVIRFDAIQGYVSVTKVCTFSIPYTDPSCACEVET